MILSSTRVGRRDSAGGATCHGDTGATGDGDEYMTDGDMGATDGSATSGDGGNATGDGDVGATGGGNAGVTGGGDRFTLMEKLDWGVYRT